jgi:hypothetical protein
VKIVDQDLLSQSSKKDARIIGGKGGGSKLKRINNDGRNKLKN